MSSLVRFFRLHRTYKKFRRYRDIAGILARHGFADVATRTGLARAWRGFKRTVSFGLSKEPVSLSTGERLKAVCEQLGPTFIKFGQVLANRPDLFPPDVIRELSKLQDSVEPFPFPDVKRIVEEELGRPPEEVFSRIDEVSLAAASIAQVHRARLVTGEEVVLKVKRPGLERVVREDLAVLRDIATYIEEHFEELEHVHAKALVEEFARTFTLEMDLRNEVRNMHRYAANFADEPGIRIPATFDAFCTANLIVMEYVEGAKVTEVTDWERFPLKPAQIAELGTRLLLRSVFEHRFYHADPHPGNFMIAADGTVCLLDFGMMGYVSESRMEELLSFMVALVSYDSQMLVETILDAGLAPASLDITGFHRDVEMMMNRFASLSIGELELEALIRAAVDTVSRHKVSIPTDLLMVARALSTMEGLALRIYPEFEPLRAVQPYLVSLFLKRALDPTHHSAQLVDVALDWVSLARQIPREVTLLLRRIKAGELTVRVDDRQAPKIAREKVRASNRLAGALLAAAGVVGSIFLAQSPEVPSYAGVLTWSVSFLLALWVVWGIRRSGGM